MSLQDFSGLRMRNACQYVKMFAGMQFVCELIVSQFQNTKMLIASHPQGQQQVQMQRWISQHRRYALQAKVRQLQR